MNDLVIFEAGKPVAKHGTSREEILSSLPVATQEQMLDFVEELFANLKTRERSQTESERLICFKTYLRKIEGYPNYALVATKEKLIDEAIFLPAISELITEIKDQIFRNIIWKGKPQEIDPFARVEKNLVENERAEFVKKTIKNIYGNQEGAPTGRIKAKPIDQRQSGEERRAAMERLKARAADLDDDKQDAGMKFLGFESDKRKAS